MTPKELAVKAYEIRKTALELVRYARSGHLGGSLSLCEILAVLYFDRMNVRPDEPHWEDRDRLVLSKGHCTPALYSTLALKGFFPMEDLKQFRKTAGNMSGHAEIHVSGVDMSTGSLGQGLSVALGMVETARMFGKSYQVYAITGDGEMQEGQIWEAVMAAGNYHTPNLTLIVDNNRLQLDGFTKDIMPLDPLKDKLEAFKWKVMQIDGHSTAELQQALIKAADYKLGPVAVIADTVKGKGVSFMENNVKYHGHVPDDEAMAQAIAEVENTLKDLEK